MSRALVAIGVSNAPPLPTLEGAIGDAEDMAKWATASNYDHVRTFTDKDSGKVRAADIIDHCEKLLKIEDLERLVVFFSGHGYAPMPGFEVWLLSGWKASSNEAINLTGSVFLAQGWERPLISFIGDACRVTFQQAQGTYGQTILPQPPQRSSKAQVDEFYATRLGDISQQYQPEEALASYGIFSKEVLNGLKGAAVLERSAKRVVTSRSLEDYLRDAVPKACADIDGAVVQQPATRAQWREPGDVYVELGPPPKPGTVRVLIDRLGVRAGIESILDRVGVTAYSLGRDGPPQEAGPSAAALVQAQLAQRDARINDDASRYASAAGRESYETATGLTVVGAGIREVVTSANHAGTFEEGGNWHVRVSGDPNADVVPAMPCTALVRISHQRWTDHWIAIPVFPELIATALVDDGGFSSLNYRAARRFRIPYLDEMFPRVTEALTQATAMFRYGVMPDNVGEIVDLLRDYKYDNPALAIVAAYICRRIGDMEQIEDMQRYQIGRGNYTPFDLMLLWGQESPPPGRTLVGTFPFMSSGWSLLQGAASPLDHRLFDAIPGLMPSLWTMADARAGRLLADIVSSQGAAMA